MASTETGIIFGYVTFEKKSAAARPKKPVSRGAKERSRKAAELKARLGAKEWA